jgi:hypothetical protein
MNAVAKFSFIFPLLALFILILLSACQSTSALKDLNEVKLAREGYISAPLESGGLFRLAYGDEIITSSKAEVVCHVPKDYTFKIDNFHYQRYSGSTTRWVYFFSITGRINCNNKEYNVRMTLPFPGNAGDKKAILRELTKTTNRFWYR